MTEDDRPRVGPHGEQVSDEGLHYWTGTFWAPLEQPFPPLNTDAGIAPTRTFETKVVAIVAIVTVIVVTLIVFLLPWAALSTPVALVAAAIFLAMSKSMRTKSWALGLVIGSGVALIISPGAACFGALAGPTAG